MSKNGEEKVNDDLWCISLWLGGKYVVDWKRWRERWEEDLDEREVWFG